MKILGPTDFGFASYAGMPLTWRWPPPRAITIANFSKVTFMVRFFGKSIYQALLTSTFALSLVDSGPASAQQGPLPVDVALPLVETIVDWDEFTGRFEAVERVELQARVSGFLQEIGFEDGQVVEEGDVLFVVDPRPFEAVWSQANAELAAAIAEKERADAELARGEELVRDRTLTESALDERRAAKLQADALVAVREAEVRSALLNVEFTEVRAPFTGRISDRKIDVGNLVTAGETLLATIVTTDPIYLVFTASEADFLKYSRLSETGERESSRTAANEVQARLIDENDWTHTGQMSFVDNELDPTAGTIRGRATFNNPDDLLTPGLFARMRLIASGEYEALLVPEEAVLSDQSRKVLLVVDGEGLVSPRVVELGPLHRGFRVIRNGLEPTDLVIVNGVQRARPGGQVTPQEVTLSLDGSTDQATAN